MTTIAWDGKTLACDSQGTVDQARVGDVMKLFHTADMAMAITGESQDAEAVWDWFKSHKSGDRPSVESL